MSWWETLLTSEAVWNVVGAGLLFVLGLVMNLLRKKGVEEQAIDTLRTAIAQVTDDFVVWRKRAAADGKLTKEERTQAVDLAKAKAKELASGPVLKLLLRWGEDRLSGLVSRIVQGEKK